MMTKLNLDKIEYAKFRGVAELIVESAPTSADSLNSRLNLGGVISIHNAIEKTFIKAKISFESKLIDDPTYIGKIFLVRPIVNEEVYEKTCWIAFYLDLSDDNPLDDVVTHYIVIPKEVEYLYSAKDDRNK